MSGDERRPAPAPLPARRPRRRHRVEGARAVWSLPPSILRNSQTATSDFCQQSEGKLYQHAPRAVPRAGEGGCADHRDEVVLGAAIWRQDPGAREQAGSEGKEEEEEERETVGSPGAPHCTPREGERHCHPQTRGVPCFRGKIIRLRQRTDEKHDRPFGADRVGQSSRMEPRATAVVRSGQQQDAWAPRPEPGCGPRLRADPDGRSGPEAGVFLDLGPLVCVHVQCPHAGGPRSWGGACPGSPARIEKSSEP